MKLKQIVLIVSVCIFFILIFVFTMEYFCKQTDISIFEQKYSEALAAFTNKDFNLTLELCNDVTKNFNNKFEAELLKSKAYFFLGKNTESLNVIKKLEKKYPNYTDAIIWHARILILLRKNNEAKQILDKQLKLNSSDWRIYYLYSLLAEQLENYELQMEMLHHSEMLINDGTKVYRELARIWDSIGMKNRAIENLVKVQILSK